MKQIETEKLTAELSSLKAQINPHFLFNTLNGIYGLALTNSDKTADSISKLASMMRYVLTETTDEKVPLANEIKYISDYITFQKLRLTKKTKVNFTIEGTSLDQEISPILFISFIENAFKYGVSNEVESTIKIHLLIENSAISLTVKNEQLKKKKNEEESCGIGLKNTKRRLDLIYENKYSLEMTNTDKAYQIILKIQLK
jgi:LytS/YehU family sensor histidine kinase